MISGVEAILLVTDGNQVVIILKYKWLEYYCTPQDHSREYFMNKLTTHYCTLPIHTVAYHCDDDNDRWLMVAMYDVMYC